MKSSSSSQAYGDGIISLPGLLSKPLFIINQVPPITWLKQIPGPRRLMVSWEGLIIKPVVVQPGQQQVNPGFRQVVITIARDAPAIFIMHQRLGLTSCVSAWPIIIDLNLNHPVADVTATATNQVVKVHHLAWATAKVGEEVDWVATLLDQAIGPDLLKYCHEGPTTALHPHSCLPTHKKTPNV